MVKHTTKADLKRTVAIAQKNLKMTTPHDETTDEEEDVEEVDQVSENEADQEDVQMDAETQDIYEELGIPGDNDPAKMAQKKADEVQSEVGSNPLMSVIEFTELAWNEDFLKNILPATMKMERQAMKARNLTTKRLISTMRQGILNGLKQLKQDKIALNKCSFDRFKGALRKGEYYTMFTRKNLRPEITDYLFDLCSENTEEPFSSSATTKTTSTLSTTATTITPPVDAQPSTSFEQPIQAQSDGDILDALLPVSASLSSTGLISQSISRRKGDTLTTWTSPGETGYQVIKLDVYNFNKICNMDKKNWWKVSEIRSTFMTNSVVDPKHIALQRLMAIAAKDLTSLPGVKREEKVTNSSNFYGNFQQRQ